MKRIISSILAVAFLISNVSFAAEIRPAAGNINLAPNILSGSLGDENHKNAAIAKILLEANLVKALGTAVDLGKPDDVIGALRKYGDLRGKEETVFEPAAVELYFTTATHLGSGIYKIPASVSKIRGSKVRLWNGTLLFSTKKVDGFFPVTPCNNDELEQVMEAIRIHGSLPARNDRDTAAINRYKDQNETIIDPFIRTRITAGDSAAIDSYILRDVQLRLGEFLYMFNLSVYSAFEGKKVMIIKVPEGVDYPVIEENGRKIRVVSHTSANAVYFFVGSKEFDAKGYAAIDPKVIIHEIGVAYGLPYEVTKDGKIVNDLDKAYESGIDPERVLTKYPRLQNMTLADLDANLAGRDYAAVHTGAYAHWLEGRKKEINTLIASGDIGKMTNFVNGAAADVDATSSEESLLRYGRVWDDLKGRHALKGVSADALYKLALYASGKVWQLSSDAMRVLAESGDRDTLARLTGAPTYSHDFRKVASDARDKLRRLDSIHRGTVERGRAAKDLPTGAGTGDYLDHRLVNELLAMYLEYQESREAASSYSVYKPLDVKYDRPTDTYLIGREGVCATFIDILDNLVDLEMERGGNWDYDLSYLRVIIRMIGRAKDKDAGFDVPEVTHSYITNMRKSLSHMVGHFSRQRGTMYIMNIPNKDIVKEHERFEWEIHQRVIKDVFGGDIQRYYAWSYGDSSWANDFACRKLMRKVVNEDDIKDAAGRACKKLGLGSHGKNESPNSYKEFSYNEFTALAHEIAEERYPTASLGANAVNSLADLNELGFEAPVGAGADTQNIAALLEEVDPDTMVKNLLALSDRVLTGDGDVPSFETRIGKIDSREVLEKLLRILKENRRDSLERSYDNERLFLPVVYNQALIDAIMARIRTIVYGSSERPESTEPPANIGIYKVLESMATEPTLQRLLYGQQYVTLDDIQQATLAFTFKKEYLEGVLDDLVTGGILEYESKHPLLSRLRHPFDPCHYRLTNLGKDKIDVVRDEQAEKVLYKLMIFQIRGMPSSLPQEFAKMIDKGLIREDVVVRAISVAFRDLQPAETCLTRLREAMGVIARSKAERLAKMQQLESDKIVLKAREAMKSVLVDDKTLLNRTALDDFANLLVGFSDGAIAKALTDLNERGLLLEAEDLSNPRRQMILAVLRIMKERLQPTTVVVHESRVGADAAAPAAQEEGLLAAAIKVTKEVLAGIGIKYSDIVSVLSLARDGAKMTTLLDGQTGNIFSQEATFGYRNGDEIEPGLGPILQSLANAKIRISVIIDNNNEHQREMVAELNKGIVDKDYQILAATSVGDAQAQFQSSNSGVSRFCYYRTEGEAAREGKIVGIESISIDVRKIIDAIGTILRIEKEEMKKLHEAALKFAYAA